MEREAGGGGKRKEKEKAAPFSLSSGGKKFGMFNKRGGSGTKKKTEMEKKKKKGACPVIHQARKRWGGQEGIFNPLQALKRKKPDSLQGNERAGGLWTPL